MDTRLIECVPNFSEGQDLKVWKLCLVVRGLWWYFHWFSGPWRNYRCYKSNPGCNAPWGGPRKIDQPDSKISRKLINWNYDWRSSLVLKVYTFVGSPDAVIEGALAAAKVAYRLINMQKHKGEHPRLGGIWSIKNTESTHELTEFAFISNGRLPFCPCS